MANQNNATCSICGKEYHRCLSCRDEMNLRPWQMFTDTSVHYQILQIIRGFNVGVYSKEEAKNKFNTINMHDLEEFKPHIKQIIKDILTEEVADDTIGVSDKQSVIGSIGSDEPTEMAKNTFISRKKSYTTAKNETK